MKWKVLSIDDDPEIQNSLARILRTRMGENEFAFTFTKNFEEGIQKIKENRFDLIFLDVHDDNNDVDPDVHPENEDQKGERVLSFLKRERFVPVIFYTGFPSKVQHLESAVVKVVDKGVALEEIRGAVNSVMATMLPHLARYIEDRSREYIWESLEHLTKNEFSEEDASDIALLTARNIAKNLSQQSVKRLIGVSEKDVNPIEIYEYPPDPSMCKPADIFRNTSDDTLWMVLTPACDFEQNKVENVLLAKVVPLEDYDIYKKWQEEERMLQEGVKSKEDARNQARNKVKELVKGRAGLRYKFLPGTFFMPDCVVDFQRLINLPRMEENDYEVQCSLDTPFREEILHLFSNYYGRIGTPDYDFEVVWEKVQGG